MPQPEAIPKLSALALAEVQSATDKYHSTGDEEAWESSMQKTLAKAHQAAYILGASERLGVPVDSPLLNSKNLSRYERDQIKSILTEQYDYLSRFIDVAPDLSEEAIDNRSDMYALAPKQTYWTGWAGQELDCVPGGCEECLTRCRCSLRRGPGGIYWDCSDDPSSCESCKNRGQQSPFAVSEADDGSEP